MRHALALAFLASILATSGCSTLFKDDYWQQVREQSDKDELARLRDDPTAALFVGVRASAAELPYQVGIPVQHVYAEGPAAKAGLRAGDEIRTIDQYPVRTPGDARWVLSAIFAKASLPDDHPDPQDHQHWVPRLKTRIVFARDGKQTESEIELTTREGYLELRRRRVLEFSRFQKTGYNGWYVSKRRTLPPELVTDYFGVTPPGDIVISEDTDVGPILFGISLFRWETAPVADALRVTVICSLLQFSSRGDDVARTLAGLIASPPAGSTDL